MKYKTIGQFNDKTYVVSNENGRLMIKKEITPLELPIYKRLMTLENEHLARVYDCFEENSKLFILREYVEGLSLDNCGAFLCLNKKRDCFSQPLCKIYSYY